MANSANHHNQPVYHGKPQNPPLDRTKANLCIAVASLAVAVLAIPIALTTPEIRCQLGLHSDSCPRSIASKAEEFYQKGSILLSSGKDREALDFFEKAIEIDPKQAKVWNRRGVALEKLGKNQQALASYNEALLLNPSDEIARQNQEALLQKLSKKSSYGSF